MLLLSSAPALTTLGIVLAAAGGVIGAIVALLKLRPEANQSAVQQAKGVMESMDILNDHLEQALARQTARGDAYRDQLQALQERYDELKDRHEHMVARWGPFPNGEETS